MICAYSRKQFSATLYKLLKNENKVYLQTSYNSIKFDVFVLLKIDFLMVETVLHFIFNNSAILLVQLPINNKLQTSISLLDNLIGLEAIIISIFIN